MWRRNPVGRAARWLGRKMPTGLYARSLMIIIIPMVILQTIIAYVFMERHWQTVTQRLSKAVTADIAGIIDIIETYPQDNEYEQIIRIARDRLRLNIAVLPPDPFPPATNKPFFSILDDILRDEITQQIGRPFWIDTVGDSNLLEIRIRLENPDKILRVYAQRSQAYASNSHIFLLWMVGASFFLIVISILFLRNQIRPIQQLANAAELYGKGRALPVNFQIRGAREVRQAGLAFLEMRERIDRQINQRTAMLTGVSHDLRTILTRFKLQVALAGDTPETEELQRDIDEMQRMLQGYLDFAKGETGENVETIRIIDLFNRHKNEAKLKDKKLTIVCKPDLQLRARPNAMARLVGNLVTNAFRHGSRITTTAIDDGQDIVITIDDNGPGIADDQMEEVFKPFIRLDEARNQDEGGTGLGLSIARDIARLHGGDISLENSPMGGLRASVRLPH
jgi:two-component system osmolarity sensor histidine kinase EnvZ